MECLQSRPEILAGRGGGSETNPTRTISFPTPIVYLNAIKLNGLLRPYLALRRSHLGRALSRVSTAELVCRSRTVRYIELPMQFEFKMIVEAVTKEWSRTESI